MHCGFALTLASVALQGVVQSVSDGIDGRVDGKRKGRVCSRDVLHCQTAAVAKLVTKQPVPASTVRLALLRTHKLIETRYLDDGLSNPHHSSNTLNSFLPGEILVQGPTVVSYPHLFGHIHSDCRNNNSLHDDLGGQDDDDVHSLLFNLCKNLAIIALRVDTFGVCETNLCVGDPLPEKISSVDAKVIVAVQEGHPAPLEVLQDLNNDFYHVFVGMHCPQKGGIDLLLGQHRARGSIADLPTQS